MALNDAKRAEMAHLVTGLLRHGWTRSAVAQRLGVSPGTVGAWARGKSMGKNAQRAELRAMLEKALADEEKNDPTPPGFESCSPGCPGWVHDVSGAIQACDACGRFKLPGGGSDDDAAKAAHDARFKDEDCPDCEPDPFADEAHPIVPDPEPESKPGRVDTLTNAQRLTFDTSNLDTHDDEGDRMRLGTVLINGTHHHVYAVRVERVDGIQQAAEGETMAGLYDAVSGDAEDALSTVAIPGLPGEYVIIITPYGD